MTFLAWHECRRILRPDKLAIALGLVAVVSLISLRPDYGPDTRHQGSITMIASSWLPLVIPLLAGMAAGSLAADLRGGFSLTLLARGISRGQYFCAKGLGGAAGSAMLTLAALTVFYVLSWIVLPSGRTIRPPDADFPGPMPALFYASPLGNDLLAVTMYMTAASALSVVGLLAGAAGANPHVAMASPLLVALLGLVTVKRPFAWLDPFSYLNLWGAYAQVFPESQRPYAAFVYWLVFASCTAALGSWIFIRRELV